MLLRKSKKKVLLILLLVMLSNILSPIVYAGKLNIEEEIKNLLPEEITEEVEDEDSEIDESKENAEQEKSETELETPEMQPKSDSGTSNLEDSAINMLNSARDTIRQQTYDKSSYKTNEFNGSFSYSYPLTLPPNRSNLMPSMSLNYNSLNKNDFSILGHGWDLGGLCKIKRSGNYGIDMLYEYDNFVVDCLGINGNLLNLDSSSVYGEYGLENYTQETKIEYLETKSWLITLQDNTKYYIGTSINNRQENEDEIYSWYIEKTIDSKGNIINYEYENEQNFVYLKSIKYGGNVNTGLENFITINLNYVIREDIQESYQILYRTVLDKLLNSVEVVVEGENNNQAQIIYGLEYIKGDNKHRNILHKINLSGLSSENVMETRTDAEFNYYKFTENIVQINKAKEEKLLPSNFQENPMGFTPNSRFNSSGYGMEWVDINGDGLLDFVYAFDYPTNKKERATYLRQHDGSLKKSEEYELPIALASKSSGNVWPNLGREFVDINNDGLKDIVGMGITVKDYEQFTYINNGHGFTKTDKWITGPMVKIISYQSSNTRRTHSPYYNGCQFVDQNLDGFVDLLCGEMWFKFFKPESTYSDNGNMYIYK